MTDGISSSMFGAAVSVQQLSTQMETGLKAMKETSDSQQAVLSSLLTGGNVTETRGQNVNILV